jgi:hypothetical protein
MRGHNTTETYYQNLMYDTHEGGLPVHKKIAWDRIAGNRKAGPFLGGG